MFLNSPSLLCFVFAGATCAIFGFGTPLYLTCGLAVHLVPVLAVARSSKTQAKARLRNCGVQYLQEQIVVRTYCSIPREIPTEDCTFPGRRDGTCASMTRALADSNASIPVTDPIFLQS